jgi:hypothetical protein
MVRKEVPAAIKTFRRSRVHERPSNLIRKLVSHDVVHVVYVCNGTCYLFAWFQSFMDNPELPNHMAHERCVQKSALSRFECSVLDIKYIPANSLDNLALASTWISFLQLSHEISSSFHGHDHIHHCSAPRREESSDYAKSKLHGCYILMYQPLWEQEFTMSNFCVISWMILGWHTGDTWLIPVW